MKMNIAWTLLVVAAGLLAVGPPSATAHGELHELIQKATKDIEQNPGDPLLYLKRAELNRAHVAWDAAMADIERAAVITNQWPELHLARAGLYLDAQWYESATMAAGRFLAHEPTNTLALTIRARALAKLGQHLAAAEDFTRTINHTREPGPELFVERANALVAGTNLNAALRGIEEGLGKLGPVVTLQLTALEIEVKQQRVDAALTRLDAIMAQAPRKETWLARRGEILQQAGRSKEAAASYQAALKELEALPPVRRNVPAMADLEKRIRTALAGINP